MGQAGFARKNRLPADTSARRLTSESWRLGICNGHDPKYDRTHPDPKSDPDEAPTRALIDNLLRRISLRSRTIRHRFAPITIQSAAPEVGSSEAAMANRMRRINVTAASSAASGPRAMRRGLVVLSMLGSLVAGGNAQADNWGAPMSFTIAGSSVYADGDIEDGTAERLESFLAQNAGMAWPITTIALTSRGGSLNSCRGIATRNPDRQPASSGPPTLGK